jgi:hypothetical protein
MTVGVDPEYDAIRQAARDLFDEFYPSGVDRPWTYSENFGLGELGSVQPNHETGKHLLMQFRPGVVAKEDFTIESLRAAAIGLLVYCEANDPERSR